MGFAKVTRDLSERREAEERVKASERRFRLLVQGVRYPPITELAQPMLRLAGLRINPNTSGPHRDNYFVAMSLKKIADGSERKIDLPAGAKVGVPTPMNRAVRDILTLHTGGRSTSAH